MAQLDAYDQRPASPILCDASECTYWARDARLNSFLLLFFLYIGQLALLNAFDEPASTNRLRDSPAIYRRRKQGDGRVPEPFDTQPKARKKDSVMLKKVPSWPPPLVSSPRSP